MESQGSSSSSLMILPAALALGLGLGVGVSSTLHKWTSSSSASSPPLSPSSPSPSPSSSSSSTSSSASLSSSTASSSPYARDEVYQALQVQLYLQVLDSRGHAVAFDNFPYYLNEQTKILLTNAACVHLKQLQYSKFTRNLSPASRTVLLSGPQGTETYHQMLAKGLAHSFGAKLLILDINDLARKVLMKCGNPRESTDSYSVFTKNFTQRLVGLFGIRDGASSDLPTNTAHLKKEDATALKRQKSWPFDDKLLVVAIYKVLRKISEASPTILYLRDVEKLILRGSNTFALFRKMINKLSGPIFVLGSRVLEESFNDQVSSMLDEKVMILFPYKIDTKAPEDTTTLVSWKSQLEEDMKAIRVQDNRNHIAEVLAANDVECDDLDSISFSDSLLSESLIEEIVVSAISHHLLHTDKPQHRSGRLVISSKSLLHGLSLFQSGQLDTKVKSESNPASSVKASSESTMKAEVKSSAEAEQFANKKPDAVADASSQKGGDNMTDTTVAPSTSKEAIPDNEFEKRIRPAIIPSGEIGVSFRDVGALDEVKDVLQEVVMLPLQRPELFNKGGLIKPCKGVLLFGPPGTGKTMLAKAVATEAGASFINVSMSTITSKWFGEDEKTVKALFTLAAKVAPTIIFIDEVDSMLGQRSRNGEHEAMRKIKNEFMAHWDGLLSKSGQRVLVLAATNRPFDLDDAIIRRFERRIMVGLPDKNNRETILRAILEKETVSDDLDYGELSAMTEGYSGSDLKNLCTVAAYRPLKELLKKEKQKKLERTTDGEKMKMAGGDRETSESVLAERSMGCSAETMAEEKDEDKDKENGGGSMLRLRPLSMEDMKAAKNQVSSSFASEGAGMNELKSWNELFGEGGSRRKEQLTYFL